MFRTFLWFFTIALCLILSIPFWIIGKLWPKNKPNPWPQIMLNTFAPLVYLTAGFKADIKGSENIVDGPALYVGNHQGLFDMVIALTSLGGIKPFLAKKESESIPFIGSWMRMFNCVFIDRGNARASLESLKKVEELLESGKSVIIFPEGTRSRCHEMSEFKAGSFRPALRAAVPIVPFVLDGTYHAWEEQHKIIPTTAKLTILKPIPTAGMEKERTKHIAEEIQEKIKEALG